MNLRSLRLLANLQTGIFIFILFSSLVIAGTIGVSPGSFDFGGVLNGGYAEYSIVTTTSSPEPLFGHIETAGDMSSWLSVFPNTTKFNTSLKDPRQITIIVQPPVDIQVGRYTGKITLVGDNEGGISGRAGSIVKASVMIPVSITITGTQRLSCTAGGFEIQDIERGFPIVALATVRNTGNVRFSPLMVLSVWDSSQKKVILKQEIKAKEILPTRSERLFVTLNSNLSTGQYWVDFSMPECDSQGLVTFSVMEEGGISDKGELTELSTPSLVELGETVPITGLFYNSGPRMVSAQLKVTIRRNGKIVGNLESTPVQVESGKLEQLQMFYVATESGSYSVSGRVLYNQKLTFEKNANFRTTDESGGVSSGIPGYFLIIIYALIIVTIIFLIRKIQKRKKKRF
jgi:hypothetical protein